MRVRDQLRLWVVDQLANDPHITVTPKQALREISGVLTNLSAEERKKQIEHIRAYAVLYYQGRHNMNTPQDVQQEVQKLEKRAERLNAVDAARVIVHKLGGPPSWQTISESLERSAKERTRELKQATAAPVREKKVERAQEVAIGQSI